MTEQLPLITVPASAGAVAPDLEVVAFGRPAPQGSKKYAGHRTSKVTGRSTAVLLEQSKRVKPWRQQVADAVQRVMGPDWVALDGPLRVEVVFTVSKPASAPKGRRTWPCTRDSGDLDKLLRSTFDALAGDAGALADDSRVVEVSASKVFPGEADGALASPGAVIRVWRVS